MDDKRSEEPGTQTGVPRDPPEPQTTAATEDAVIRVPTGHEGEGAVSREEEPAPDEPPD